jgi:3-oxoacyl-[acyl-carrier-protein] synthase-1
MNMATQAAVQAPLFVLGCGAVTSLGGSLEVSVAAARAGVRRMLIDDATETNIAPVGPLVGKEPAERARAMLLPVLDEVMRGPKPTLPLKLGVWIAAPAALRPAQLVKRPLTRIEGFTLTGVKEVGGHGSAPLAALPQVAQALARQEADLALVIAFDVRTDGASLAAALDEEKTIGLGRCWGHAPGDAAAAVLLGGPAGMVAAGRTPQFTVVATGVGREPVLPKDTTPCIGTGLTEAIQAALGGLAKDAKIDVIVTDINGERARSDEWGFTIPRITERVKDPDAAAIPATCWGDTGAANGLLAMGFGAAILRDLEPPDARVLVWTGGDQHERAAVVLQAAPAAATARAGQGSEAAASKPRPKTWAAALDRDVVEELLEEGAYRYRQRLDLLAELAGGERPRSWAPIERVEELLDTVAVGLGRIGARVDEVAAQAVSRQQPGTLYVALRALAERGALGQAVALAARFAADDAALARAAVDAFKHALDPRAAPARALPALLAGSVRLAGVALDLAAASGTPVPPAARQPLGRGLSSGTLVPTARAAALAMALGASRELDRLMSAATDPVLRRDAAAAALLAGGADGRLWIARAAATDPALILPAAIGCDRQSARQLCERAAALATAEGVLALGLIGHAAAVPPLLAALGGPHAVVAATALELLLGDAPVEQETTPDEDPSAPARLIHRRSLRAEAWEMAARVILPRVPSETRLRAGRPACAAAIGALLTMPHLPDEARRWLALELAVRHGVRPAPDVSALVRVQRERWRAIAARLPEHVAGAWDLARVGTEAPPLARAAARSAANEHAARS